jgi:apolipoprotein N-acyltransferase
MLANTGIARAVAVQRWEPAAGAALAALLTLAFAARWAGPRPEQGPPIPVRIVQPNTPILGFADRAAIENAYRTMLDLSRDACDRDGALVLWPESAGWPYILERDAAFRADVEAQAARGCGILLNSPRFDGELVYNTAFLIRRGASTAHYDKRHLVPFGEYVPMQQLLPFVGALARNAGNFAASDHISLLHYGPVELGLAICFEITFPAETAALAHAGATALVTLTNDAWYGASAAPWQHLRAARFRAAETHRTVLRAALTGVSAWIEPDGSLAATLSVGEQGILRGELAPRHERTPFVRAPWAVPIVCLIGSLVGFAFVIFDRRSHR